MVAFIGEVQVLGTIILMRMRWGSIDIGHMAEMIMRTSAPLAHPKSPLST